jgi:hypothetical protein
VRPSARRRRPGLLRLGLDMGPAECR